jgi:hypothetical protein
MVLEGTRVIKTKTTVFEKMMYGVAMLALFAVSIVMMGCLITGLVLDAKSKTQPYPAPVHNLKGFDDV